MGVTDRIWDALTAMIKLEDKVTCQAETMMAQQARIESLTKRVIRLEARLGTKPASQPPSGVRPGQSSARQPAVGFTI